METPNTELTPRQKVALALAQMPGVEYNKSDLTKRVAASTGLSSAEVAKLLKQSELIRTLPSNNKRARIKGRKV